MTITSRTTASGLPRPRDTERRRKADLERRVADQTARLQAAQREIDVLTHAIAHDLRSPLRTIASGAQILLEDGRRLGDEAREWTGRIAAAAARMDALVLGLLDYAGLTETEAKLQTVDPGAVVRDILARMAPAIARAKAKVGVDGPLPPVRAHVRSLELAISTLLSNAVKFARDGVAPRVRIRAERRGRSVRLWVDDNGIGIAPEHQHRLFGVFERLERRERFDGAGIGLAVAKRLVERMGGAVGVKSEPGRGSSFFLDLTGA